MAEYKQLMEQAQQLYDKAKGLLSPAEGEPSGEDREHAAKMIQDANELKDRAIQMQGLMEQISDGQAQLEQMFGEGEPQQRAKQAKNFKDWGAFLTAVRNVKRLGQVDPRLKSFDNEFGAVPFERKAMTGATGEDGGALIPDEQMAELQSVMAERSIVRRRATVIPMTRRTLPVPVVDQTDTTAGQPHWFGGMTFTWSDEAEAGTESSPQFKTINLTVHDLIGYTRGSNTLLEDTGGSLSSFLIGEMGFAGGAAWMEDYAFLRGDGVGKPQGILEAPATIAATRATGSNVGFADLVGMLQAFLPGPNAAWVVTQGALSELVLLEGPSGNPSYLWVSAEAGVPGSLLGYPVIFTEKLPALGSAGDVMLCDFSKYLIGDRKAISIESDRSERFQYNQTSWRMVHRVGGQPWLGAAITLADGSTQVSPFVALAA